MGELQEQGEAQRPNDSCNNASSKATRTTRRPAPIYFGQAFSAYWLTPRHQRSTSSSQKSLDRLSRDQEDTAAIYKRLGFAGVKIVALSEGEISELHVGLKGTMNALYLKDLADKTRRGLRGRIEAGKSGGGNAYGYVIVHALGSDGQLIRGDRKVDASRRQLSVAFSRITQPGCRRARSRCR